jgi:hypothetical protein
MPFFHLAHVARLLGTLLTSDSDSLLLSPLRPPLARVRGLARKLWSHSCRHGRHASDHAVDARLDCFSSPTDA